MAQMKKKYKRKFKKKLKKNSILLQIMRFIANITF